MTRAAAGLACLGVVGLAAVFLATATLAHASPPPPEGCTWGRHTKTVTRTVRRHGKLRKVKRKAPVWQCQRVSPAPPPPAPAFPPLEPAIGPPDGAGSTVGHLGIKAVEYSYTLSRPEVAAGELIVELNNQGEDSHNLRLQLEDSKDPPLEVPETPAEAHSSARFTVPPGTYRLYCSIFEHDQKGMHATLVVGADPSGQS